MIGRNKQIKPPFSFAYHELDKSIVKVLATSATQQVTIVSALQATAFVEHS